MLRELLGAKEPNYSLRIRQLEQYTKRQTIDLRLTSVITVANNSKIAQLGLDHSDATEAELYHAVIAAGKSLDKDLSQRYSTPDALFKKLHSYEFAEVPVVKPAVLKKILRTLPPKRVMKTLGFSSIDSFLKRADMDQVMLGVFAVESLTWHRAFTKQLRKLEKNDITLAAPRVTILDPKLVRLVRLHPVYAKTSAVVGLVPSQSTLQLAASAAAGVLHIHTQGVYVKARFYSDDFLQVFVASVYHPIRILMKIGAIGVQWASIYDALCRQQAIISSLEAPLLPEDFSPLFVGDILSHLSKQAEFFTGTECLGTKLVSFHPNDVAINLAGALPLHGSSCAYRAAALERELLSRYAEAAKTEDELLDFIGV